MKQFQFLLVLIAFGAFTSVAGARIIHVPADSSTIQGGINGTVDGDTVLVAPGMYVENIDFSGHNIILGSLLLTTGDTSYVLSTIIDGDSSGSVVTFKSGEDSNAVITGFTIQNGYALDGAGIYCRYSSPSIINNTISGNSASRWGGGIYCSDNSNPAITNNTITGNSASHRGGGICCNNSNPAINNNTISGNTAGRGGGITCYNSSPAISGNTISDNSAEWGGGINCMSNSSPDIIDNTISHNSTVDLGGGGINCQGYSRSIISNNTFDWNSANGAGGAIRCMFSCSLTISNNTISNNTAGSMGGGIYSESADLTVSGNTIRDNSGVGDGGGICSRGMNAVISNNVIRNNATNGRGGGVYISNFDTFELNEVSHNIASGTGGGVYLTSCSGQMNNNTIASNTGAAGGGLYHSWTGAPELVNCILWDNDPQQIDYGSGGNVYAIYSDIQDGWPGEGNIDADPLFCYPDTMNYWLAANSPCIGSGQNGENMGAYGVGCEQIPTLSVISPAGGEEWCVGSTYDITWDCSGIDNAKIDYSTNGGSTWMTIVASTPCGVGNYPWMVPNTPSSNCLVRICDAADNDPCDESDSIFAIETCEVECDTIPLYPGWQCVSTNIDPDPCEIESIFVNCWIGHLDIIKADDGSFCIPGVGCWIDCWDVCEMYKVHMADACTIRVCGSRVPTDKPCPLSAGWSWIAYFPDCPLEPETALVSIWDNLSIVIACDGSFCIPGVGCWIDCMEYNEGYKIHLSSVDTLIYPTSCPPCPPPFAKKGSYPGFAQTTHFNYSGNTGESYSIVVNSIELSGKHPEVGDEIGVFTSSGLCVGAGVWQEDILGIAVWQDDDHTEAVDGFKVGEEMVFKLWDKRENKEIELSVSFEKGDGTFGTVVDPASGGDAYALVNLKGISSQLPKQFELAQNYPNPFNPETKISYALPKDCHVKLTIYNMLGQKINVLVDEHQTAGHKNVHWDGKDYKGNEVASGIYFFRIEAGNLTQSKKMMILK